MRQAMQGHSPLGVILIAVRCRSFLPFPFFLLLWIYVAGKRKWKSNRATEK